jgi:hypothetical protein
MGLILKRNDAAKLQGFVGAAKRGYPLASQTVAILNRDKKALPCGLKIVM